ncbi:hypothetical protein IW261DRAFT_1594022 [Armillaria novae-zelandiae]|uniref:Uncharacterized protein n=1 Tax=Armillaria novae-zelandiae TaxID=153914 RepID=A0AA39P8C8_9AGAR|nr:hypothetical protein IW261DRAFT_1594022 [Armillaria novae-zelandiae]
MHKCFIPVSVYFYYFNDSGGSNIHVLKISMRDEQQRVDEVIVLTKEEGISCHSGIRPSSKALHKARSIHWRIPSVNEGVEIPHWNNLPSNPTPNRLEMSAETLSNPVPARKSTRRLEVCWVSRNSMSDICLPVTIWVHTISVLPELQAYRKSLNTKCSSHPYALSSNESGVEGFGLVTIWRIQLRAVFYNIYSASPNAPSKRNLNSLTSPLHPMLHPLRLLHVLAICLHVGSGLARLLNVGRMDRSQQEGISVLVLMPPGELARTPRNTAIDNGQRTRTDLTRNRPGWIDRSRTELQRIGVGINAARLGIKKSGANL